VCEKGENRTKGPLQDGYFAEGTANEQKTSKPDRSDSIPPNAPHFHEFAPGRTLPEMLESKPSVILPFSPVGYALGYLHLAKLENQLCFTRPEESQPPGSLKQILLPSGPDVRKQGTHCDYCYQRWCRGSCCDCSPPEDGCWYPYP
jgi:hypothetical protein